MAEICIACLWHDESRKDAAAKLVQLDPQVHGRKRWRIIYGDGTKSEVLRGDPRACLCGFGVPS